VPTVTEMLSTFKFAQNQQNKQQKSGHLFVKWYSLERVREKDKKIKRKEKKRKREKEKKRKREKEKKRKREKEKKRKRAKERKRNR
jgi:hypothetical protein